MEEDQGPHGHAALAVYRTAQEALSNVRKHAAGADVGVELAWQPAAVQLTVSGSGAVRPPVGGPPRQGTQQTADAGSGLRGMAERARLAGGAVEAGPHGAGFRVRLAIPLPVPQREEAPRAAPES